MSRGVVAGWYIADHRVSDEAMRPLSLIVRLSLASWRLAGRGSSVFIQEAALTQLIVAAWFGSRAQPAAADGAPP